MVNASFRICIISWMQLRCIEVVIHHPNSQKSFTLPSYAYPFSLNIILKYFFADYVPWCSVLNLIKFHFYVLITSLCCQWDWHIRLYLDKYLVWISGMNNAFVSTCNTKCCGENGYRSACIDATVKWHTTSMEGRYIAQSDIQFPAMCTVYDKSHGPNGTSIMTENQLRMGNENQTEMRY